MKHRRNAAVAAHEGRCRERERNVQSVDEWLADKTSAFCKLVPARPLTDAPRRRSAK
jgi:hypothetical protein